MELGTESSIKPGEFKDCKKFGRLLKISPKAMTQIVGPTLEMVYNVDTAVVSIDIGEHTAHLVMTKQAWEDFNNEAKTSIRTAFDFKKTISLTDKLKK